MELRKGARDEFNSLLEQLIVPTLVKATHRGEREIRLGKGTNRILMYISYRPGRAGLPNLILGHLFKTHHKLCNIMVHYGTHREVGKLHDTLIIFIIRLKYCVTITVAMARMVLFHIKHIHKIIMVLFINGKNRVFALVFEWFLTPLKSNLTWWWRHRLGWRISTIVWRRASQSLYIGFVEFGSFCEVYWKSRGCETSFERSRIQKNQTWYWRISDN